MAAADAPRQLAADGFRSDINGLRAVSIALVVAYHLVGPLTPGGFIGVDVFFVISGFLMTNIIVGRLREDRFRLWDFYLARLRRIWPALAALCAALTAIGCFALDPWTLERLSGDIPATLVFASNLLFAQRLGYFAPDEGANWLLHTWSLSVEWQFYLLYPLLLLGVFTAPWLRRRLWLVIAALTVASFALAVVVSARGQGWSFYLLPTRAWELLAGALCAGVAGVRLGGVPRAALHVAGLALIGAGAWFAVPGVGWPSATALLPVGGASLVIVAGLKRTVWADNPLVATLGRASYSIYIWHWPVIVALRYADVAITPTVALAAVAAMLALGLASYRVIEQAATRWLFATGARRWGLAGACAALAAVAMIAAGTQGFETFRTAAGPPPIRAALADDRAASIDWAYPGACGQYQRTGPLTVCRIGDPFARQVLVIGDSHAEEFAPRYVHAFDGQPGRGVTFVTSGGCPPIPGIGLRHRGRGCGRWARAAFRYAESAGFARVAVISTWQPYFDPGPGAPLGGACRLAGDDCDRAVWRGTPGDYAASEFMLLEPVIAALRRRGTEVVLFGPTPRGEAADPLRRYRRAFWTHDVAPQTLDRRTIERRTATALTGLSDVSRRTGAPLVSMLDGLCSQGACPIEAAGHTLFKDANHFRASAVTGPRFAYLDPWLAPAPAPTRLK